MIYLFQAGGPSHLELFDHKPELKKRDGQLPPADLLKGYRAAFINPNSALLGPKYGFQKYGSCGTELSELLPHTGAVADDLCLVRTVHTEAVNHAPAQIMMNTGSQQFGRPSFGAWSLYGLGSEGADLPGYVVTTWYGVFAPVQLPKPYIAKLNQTLAKIFTTADARQRLAALGAEPVTMSPEQFALAIRKETAKWAKVIKESGARPE